jgi:hypothetical protein
LPNGKSYFVAGTDSVEFLAELAVKNNRLVAIGIPEGEETTAGESVLGGAREPCDAMWLLDPVNFYLAEHGTNPLPVKPGQELWIEVTVPPEGPPRPIQLALKDNGVWKPLAFQ